MSESVRKRIFWIFFILSAGWMGLIFSFSAQPAAESAELSTGTADWLLSSFWGIPFLQNLAKLGILEFLIRKLAHAAEYGILGILLGTTIYSSKRWQKKWQFKTICLCALYACTDEFHQLFVPGRSGQVRDVAIDLFGAFCAVLLLWFAFVLYGKYRPRQYF